MTYYDVYLLDSIAAYDGLYTYKSPIAFRKGDVVRVPFGKGNQQREALIEGISTHRSGVKTISSTSPIQSISEPHVDLLLEMSEYFLAPRGDMLRLALPKLTRKSRSLLWMPTGKPIPQHLREDVKSVEEGEAPTQALLEGEYFFGRERKEAFYLSTTLTLQELEEAMALLPKRKKRLRKILRALQEKYPEPVEASEIPKALRDEMIHSGDYRFSLQKMPKQSQPPAPLSEAQELVYRALCESEEKLHLLWGVSASGKSHLFLHLCYDAVRQGRKVLVLFPDNRVLQAAAAQYHTLFPGMVGMYQGRMSPGQLGLELARWQDGRTQILLGTRGALLLPLPELSMVLMDECQEDEYLSEHPIYDARRAAQLMSRRLGVKTIYASATPPIELLFYPDLQLHRLRVSFSGLPAAQPQLLPMGSVKGTLHPDALEAIRENLERKEKTLLLSTRSGYASSLHCAGCGSLRSCVHCDRGLLHFKSEKKLKCLSCSVHLPESTPCPHCGEVKVLAQSPGIEQVHEELSQQFPTARVLRMDRSTSGGARSFEAWEEVLGKGEFDLLLGNKLVSRGFELDFTLAIALSGESTLYLPETRAPLKTFSRLYQFFSRAGRKAPAHAYLQAMRESYVFNYLAKADLWGFYEEEIRLRRAQQAPPFSKEIVLSFRGEDLGEVERERDEALIRLAGQRALSYEPIFPFRKGQHERRILLRYDVKEEPDKAYLRTFLREMRTLKFRVDPEYLLY